MEIKDIEFVENTGFTGYDFETESDRFDVDNFVSHNCRTRVISNDVYPEKAITVGRGNLSFTTINLPRLAITTKLENNEEVCSPVTDNDLIVFYNKLDNIIDLIFEQLMQKFEILAKKKVYNFPFLFGQGVHIDSEYLDNNDEIREAMKQGTMSIGFIGLAETLKALTGKHHGESDSSYAIGYDIIKHIRARTDKATKDLGYNFSTFATPAEGLSSRFTKIDKRKYGIIPGVTDREYYTNSFHIPVYYDILAYKKMKLEGPFHQLCNAGAITYVELDGDLVHNTSVIEKLVKYSKECGIDYFSINHAIDTCPICRYQGIINGNTCPSCGWVEGTEINICDLKQKGINIKNLNLRFENESEKKKYF
jgi:ribonucleoside-triphosphate reductase